MKRTEGILQDLELLLGKQVLDDIWYGVQFGKCSGVTCCVIVKDCDDAKLPSVSVGDLGRMPKDSSNVD